MKQPCYPRDRHCHNPGENKEMLLEEFSLRSLVGNGAWGWGVWPLRWRHWRETGHSQHDKDLGWCLGDVRDNRSNRYHPSHIGCFDALTGLTFSSFELGLSRSLGYQASKELSIFNEYFKFGKKVDQITRIIKPDISLAFVYKSKIRFGSLSSCLGPSNSRFL